jgi:hypothetical protein
MELQQQSPLATERELPWYKQFWPWFIIALPTAAVIASFVSLWLAVTHPDQLIVTDDEYQQIRDDLKAHPTTEVKQDTQAARADSKSN